MQELHYTTSEDREYEHDVRRMAKIMAERGYSVSASNLKKAWEDYSESMAAGWMMLDEDDDLVFSTLRNRLSE